MEIAKWKFVLSHLFDIKLQELNSEKNGKMNLLLSSGQFKLASKNAIYSFGKKYSSFGNAFDKLNLIDNTTIKSVLVLGWGIGSISKLLENNKSVNKIVGVEYDEVLVEVYKKHFSNQYKFEELLYNDDAISFMNNNNAKFDLICSDVFEDNITPEAIISKEYIFNLNNCLNIGGLVLLSKLNRTTTDVQQNKKLESNLKEVVGKFDCIRSFGNNIYYWQKNV